MRFAAEPGLIHHLLCGRGLELRPDLSGGLVSAAKFPNEGEIGLTRLAERTIEAIAGQFTPVPNLSLLSVNAAYRPMTGDGSPLRKFLPGIAGLYAVVAHPGVILAPYLGRLAAQDIVEAQGVSRRRGVTSPATEIQWIIMSIGAETPRRFTPWRVHAFGRTAIEVSVFAKAEVGGRLVQKIGCHADGRCSFSGSICRGESRRPYRSNAWRSFGSLAADRRLKQTQWRIKQ
jgi:hypothetical protein